MSILKFVSKIVLSAVVATIVIFIQDLALVNYYSTNFLLPSLADTVMFQTVFVVLFLLVFNIILFRKEADYCLRGVSV